MKLTTNQKSPDSYVFEFIRDGKPDFVSRDEIKDAISRQLARLKTGKDSRYGVLFSLCGDEFTSTA